MKKSDMLVIIAKEASRRSTTHYLYDAYEHAEEILFAIQKAGMLPPLSNEFISKHNPEVAGDVLNSAKLDFKWDRENEEEEEEG
jgi:hypothetical protein